MNETHEDVQLDGQLSQEKNEETTLKERLAYAGTDAGGNLLYNTLTSFINYFHTDIFGLPLGTAAFIALIVRIINTATVPIWGLAIDKTKSKYGKSRPWFARLAIPFGIFISLTFFTPNLDLKYRVIYAAITYLTASILYTGISTPITSILPNLSNNSIERTKLNSFRMIGGNVGYFITATFTLFFVNIFGGGDRQQGFFLTAVMFSVVSIFLFFFAFKNTKEINTEDIGTSLSVKESFSALKGNWPWIIIVASFIFYWLGNSSRTSALIYYANYNLGNENYVSILNGLVLTQMIGVIAIPFLVKRFSKTTTMIIGLTVASFGQICLGLAGNNFPFIITAWVVASLGTGIAVSMPFALLSDTVDYGEYKTGVRASGFLTAVGSAVGIQVGTGVGDFIPLKLMEYFGYVANQEQSNAALSAIKFGFSYLPAVFFIFGAIIMFFYYKYERNEKNVIKELKKRHDKKYSTSL